MTGARHENTLARALRRLAPLACIALALVGCSARSQREPGDQEFPSALAPPSAALIVPGAWRATRVEPDGDLANGRFVVHVSAAADGRAAAPPAAITFEDRWLPIAHWARRDEPLLWRFEALACESPTRDVENPLTSLRVEVSNSGPRPATARLEVSFARCDSSSGFSAWAADTVLAALPGWGVRDDEPSLGWASEASDGPRFAHDVALQPGEHHTYEFLFAAKPTEKRTLAEWARTSHAARAQAARRQWRAEVERGARFALGDPELEDAIRAARVLLLSCWEYRPGGRVPIGGPFQYRDVWLRDAARAVTALSVHGYTGEARAFAHGLLAFQWEHGPFVSQRGQLDGTGEALWALAQAALRPSPDSSAATFAQAGLRAAQWYAQQRNLGLQSGAPTGPLMPSADPRDNEMVRANLVGNDAWAIAGLEAAARLFDASGASATGDSLRAMRAERLGDFQQALARMPGPRIASAWQGSGRDWGNLALAWPCRVLPAADARVLATAASSWARAGGAGLTLWRPDTLHSYVGADLGTWALLADRPAAADSVLRALVHWRDGTGAAAETFSPSTGEYGRNLPPHPTSAAALLSLVRNMIVYDDGDSLQLTLGCRESWWRDGSLAHAPTRWGLLDVRFRARDGHAEWDWTPVKVPTVLRVPIGSHIAGAPSPLSARPLGDHAFVVPAGVGHASVAIARDAS